LRFSKESPSRVLHWILGKVLEIHESPAAGIPLKAMRGMLMNLGICLTNLDMISEGIAWERLKICILRYMASGEHSAGTLPQLAMAFRELSLGYLRQLRLELALQASDQSLGLWRHISETLPEVDHRVGLVTAMSMHAEALLQSGQVAAALSLAQEAVAIARPMVARIIASGSEPAWAEEDEFEAVTFSELSFILAEALASAGRHYESYETAKEVFEIMLGLPISEHPPPVTTIDSFLNQICKLAEQDSFPLVMLADCVILFRDLVHKFAGKDPQICSHLVWLLYAYVYFSRQDNSSSMDTLRMFLEPSSEHPPPELDASGNPMACIDLFDEAGSVIQDAVRAFYAYRWQSDTSSLIRTIFVTHFEQAIGVFREVIERACSDASLQATSTEWARTLAWALYSTLGILDALPFFDNSKRAALLQIMTTSIGHLGTLLARVSDLEFPGSFIADSLFRELWAIGLLDDALAVSTHKIEHFCDSSHDAVDNPRATGLIERALLLYDMGRFQEAVQSVQQLQAVLPESVMEYERRNVLCLIQTRILLRTERNREAIHLLRKRVTERKFYHKVDSDFLLFVELATAWASVGHPRRALQAVELAVVGTDFDAEKGSQTEWALRMHVFTTRSDCLSATGLDSEAFAAAQQATRLYNENAQHIMFSTIRIKEWGANAFRALSCRYAVADAYGVPDPYQALVTAQTATKLYRELVELAPTHLPILARSLRDLASNLWTVGRRVESAATCEEAANIMRNVVITESYFLPALAEVLEQLAGYLKETGSAAYASAATAECAEVRRKFESLPPEPDFIFEEIKMEWADEDEGNGGDVWEIVGNSDDEYCDVSRAAADVEEVVLPGEAPTGVFQDVTLPNPPVFSDPEPSEVSVSAGVFTRVDSEVSLAASPPTYLNATSTSATSQVTSGEEKVVDPATDTDTHKTGKRRVSDLLNTPLEVKLSTTPMDILWWVLVGILSILVGILSVALTVVLSRRP
jgi:tetratricopeptide (TPR) repeat protein